MEEIFEVWTWTQLGAQSKPVGLFNVQGFFTPLIVFLDQLVENGFLQPHHRKILQLAHDPEELLARLSAFENTP